MAWLAGRLLRQQRAILESNLAPVLKSSSPRHRRKAAREIFEHAFRAYYELFALSCISPEEIVDRISFDEAGWARFEKAHGGGKGIVFVGTHQSNFDLAGQAVAARGYPLLVLSLPATSDLFATLDKARANERLRTVQLGPRALREALRALRRGEVVVVAGDRPFRGQGTVVEFFGRPTLLPDGHIRLALRTGAAVVCAHTLREEGRYWLRLHIVDVVRTGDDKADVLENAQRIARVLEGFVRSHPEQWHLFQRLWD
jgi:KDO2-lipid IV(A) lauroyltransferase